MRPGQGEIRSASILNIDLRGFTNLTAILSPDEVMAMLADYQKRMIKPIMDRNGCIDKFMGDGILAHFGAANDSETYAADCLNSVVAIMQDVDKWNLSLISRGEQPVKIGVAVASGDVLFGTVGDDERLEFTTIGEAVNLSAKLEKHTKIEGVSILVTLDTYKKAVAQGFSYPHNGRELLGVKVDGVKNPLDLYGIDFLDH